MSVRLSFIDDYTSRITGEFVIPADMMLKDTNITDGKTGIHFNMKIGVKFARSYSGREFSYDSDIEFLFITRLEPPPGYHESNDYMMMFVGAQSGTPYFMEVAKFVKAFMNGSLYITDTINIQRAQLAHSNPKVSDQSHYLEFDEDDDDGIVSS